MVVGREHNIRYNFLFYFHPLRRTSKKNSPNITFRLIVIYVRVLDRGTKPHTCAFSGLVRKNNIVFLLPSFFIMYFKIRLEDLII